MIEQRKAASLKYLLIVICCFTIVVLTYNMFLGQKIPFNDGLGWDGYAQAQLTKHLFLSLSEKQYPLYSIQQYLPSFIIFVSAKLFHFTLSNTNLLFASQILNYIVFLSCIAMWYVITRALDLKLRILSFTGLFISFSFLKMYTYIPYSPDTVAMLMGICIYYAWFNNKTILFLIFTILGIFTFPSIAFLSLLLFAWKQFPSHDDKNRKLFFNNWWHYAALFSMFIVLVACVLNTFYYTHKWQHVMNAGIPDMIYLPKYLSFLYTDPVKSFNIPESWFYFSGAVTPVNYVLLPLSMLCLACYVYKSVSITFKKISLSCFFELFDVKKFCYYIVVVYGVLHIISYFFASKAPGFTIMNYFLVISGTAVVNPFVFLIALFCFYGPIILLLIYFWPIVIKYLKSDASTPGVLLFVCLSLLMSLGSESRMLINIVPFMIFTLAQALSHHKEYLKKISYKFIITFILLSVIGSRFYLHINYPKTEPATLYDVFQHFPYQSFWMNSGPWMSHMMYYWFTLAAILNIIVMFYVYKKSNYDYCDIDKELLYKKVGIKR